MGKISGLLFFLAGFVVFMGITTAEIFYPNYSVSKDFISNLGSTRPPTVVIKQPSAMIFDTAMIVAGLLILVGVFLSRKIGDKMLSAAMSFTGAGAMAIGLFPAYYGMTHDLIAGFAFLAGGVSALLSSKVTTSPFKDVSIALGTIALGFLFAGILAP